MPERRSEEPETTPRGILLVPPSPPPAPPGTGAPPPPPPESPPGDDPGEGGEDWFDKRLIDALNDFAVIRTTLQTLALFPDEALAAELDDVVSPARGRLVELFSGLASGFPGEPRSLADFRATMEHLAEHGEGLQRLNRMLQVDLYAGGGDPERCCRYLQGRYPTAPRSRMTDSVYCTQLMYDLVEQLQSPAGQSFEDVYRDFCLVVFGAFSSLDPLFRRL